MAFLLERGANPNATDKGGMTPIHLATLEGHMAIVKQLLAKKVDLTAANDRGMTPLHKKKVLFLVDMSTKRGGEGPVQ